MISGRDIRIEILNTRKDSIMEKGFHQGLEIPHQRKFPVVPCPKNRILICEIKRSSPSKGAIGSINDPEKQAGLYIDGGADIISVLTEENYFHGSLKDLIAVKNRYPLQPVLRKDFLYSVEDVEVSYQAGADLILLIASILEKDTIVQMYKRVKELGMEALVEVHNLEDIRKVSDFSPDLVGINSRDLQTFKVDLTLPLRIKENIDWDPVLIFESGIRYKEDVEFALSSGFNGILVGESVVKDTDLVRDFKNTMNKKRGGNFWEKLFLKKQKGPFIKICGLTLTEDVIKADELGADIVGFILAESPRQAAISFIRNLPPTKALKAGVVVLKYPGEILSNSVKLLLDNGKLDVIQFHGNEDPAECASIAYPYYKAVRLKDDEDIIKMDMFRSPRVLIDAYSAVSYGGTGRQISETLIEGVKKKHPLWLAGGLSPDNIRDLIAKFDPELIDLSSKLEESPGIKDHRKMEQLFSAIRQGTETS